jgi:hypothetical protein
MSVEIVVVSYNTRDILATCLRSIAATCRDYRRIRTIIVDNASTDGSADMVRRVAPRAHLIELDRNLGFGPANNRGMAAGSAPYVLFLNSDAELTPGAVDTLKAFLEQHPDCVAVGPRLVYPDHSFHPSLRRYRTVLRNFWNTAGLHTRFPRLFPFLHDWLREDEHVSGRRVHLISGACMMLRRDYLESIGGFDENVFLYEEEMDVLYPAKRKRKKVCYCGEATVIHHHGASSGETKQPSDTVLLHAYRSKYYVYRKHHGRIRARMLYWSDRIPFGLSALQNRLRNRPSPSARHYAFCKWGFIESFNGVK